MIALLLALPLVTCVSLALLPPGRAAAIGIAVAAAVVAAVSRRAAGETGAGIAWIRGGAVALAALAQGLRWGAMTMGRQQSYPLVFALCGAGAVVPVLIMIGAN
jgi:hypothetical protein